MVACGGPSIERTPSALRSVVQRVHKLQQVVLAGWVFVHPGVEVDGYVDDRSLAPREVIAALLARSSGK